MLLSRLSHWNRTFLLSLTAALFAVSALAEPEPKSLIDLSAENAGVKITGNGGSAEVADGEAGKVLAVTVNEGQWPGVNFAPQQGQWDLSEYNAVQFTLTNTSDVKVRVHGRVDNPGSWKNSPWSVNATSLKPGESGKITVAFGKSYGNPGYELDPSKIIRVVIFAEKPKQDIILHVTAIEAIKTAGGNKPASSGGTSGGGGEAAQAPESNVLYDFDSNVDESRLQDNGTSHEITDAPATDGGASGKALRVTFSRGESYPGVHLNAPKGGWDLSNFAGVEVELTNAGSVGVTAALRVDNPGDWKKNPWNAEKTHLKPGQTKTLRVKFGQSWGSPGFALNPGKVIRGLVYAERPKEGAVILVDNLRAYGQPMTRETDSVDLSGVLFDFGPDFILANRVEEQDATARIENGQLVAEFSSTAKWPAVLLRPVARKWDLSNFQSVQADLTNLADTPIRIGLRVDNPGGHTESNTELTSLKPGQTQTLTVTFGQSWGKQAYALDPAKVVALLVYADQPKATARIAIDNIKANRKQYAQVPEWIGTRPPVEGDWQQTLDENFDGPSLDTSKWTPRLVWDGPAGAETQRYREENVSIEDGKLTIKCEKNPGHQYDNPNLPTRQYATGAVTSLDKWTQKYGYLEARIKRPTARGLWPAFWLMPDRGEGNGDIWKRRSTNDGGMEIDIWEHLTEWGPHRYNVAAHWDGYGKDHKQWGNSHIYHLPTEDGWHNYGLLWEPGKLTWFADGKKVAEWEDKQVTDVPLYIKFTVQMGNWATKDVDDAALPDKFQIDYVRAWQLADRVDQ